ncbi:hypothetical protein ACQPXM_41415 (plasmid) [Kribbella sp. CA-253562]|uniref:hypothetical protein n=1 Tax=Kribbella sp. CA-253562 TaxID=3239942 RepID=UPI003D8C0BBD
MRVPATLEIRAEAVTGESRRTNRSEYFSADAAPTQAVPPIVRFLDWCQQQQVTPDGTAYENYTAANPQDRIDAADQPEPVVSGSPAFVYDLNVMQVPGGWVGSLKVRCQSVKRRSNRLQNLVLMPFRSDDTATLHKWAVYYLTRRQIELMEMNRPEETAAAETELKQQIAWHTSRAAAELGEVA